MLKRILYPFIKNFLLLNLGENKIPVDIKKIKTYVKVS